MGLGSNCLYCKIVEKKIPAKIVYEDELSIAFEDLNPKAPVHVLIIPRKHIEDIHSMVSADRELIGHLFLVARTIASNNGLDKNGYRMVINNGRDAGQTVFHLHLHVMSGRPFLWPPG